MYVTCCAECQHPTRNRDFLATLKNHQCARPRARQPVHSGGEVFPSPRDNEPLQGMQRFLALLSWGGIPSRARVVLVNITRVVARLKNDVYVPVHDLNRCDT